MRFTRQVQQLDSFQEGWAEVFDPDTGVLQLQRIDAAATAAAAAAAEQRLEVEQRKVTDLLAKHGLQAFEPRLREMGATSPIHLAHLRADDVQTLNPDGQARRSFAGLLQELPAHAMQYQSRAGTAAAVAAAETARVLSLQQQQQQQQQQPGPLAAPARPDGYVAFSTPEPKRAPAAAAGVVLVAQVTPAGYTGSSVAPVAAAATIGVGGGFATGVSPPASAEARTLGGGGGGGAGSGSAEDWETKRDPVSGKPFYFNLKTNERSFAIPPVLAAAAASTAGAAPTAATASTAGGGGASVSTHQQPSGEPQGAPAAATTAGAINVHQQEQVDTHMGSARGGYSPTPPLTLEAEEAVDSSEGGASTPSTPGTAGSAAAAAAAAAVLQHSDPFGEDDEPPAYADRPAAATAADVVVDVCSEAKMWS